MKGFRRTNRAHNEAKRDARRHRRQNIRRELESELAGIARAPKHKEPDKEEGLSRYRPQASHRRRTTRQKAQALGKGEN